MRDATDGPGRPRVPSVVRRSLVLPLPACASSLLLVACQKIPTEPRDHSPVVEDEKAVPAASIAPAEAGALDSGSDASERAAPLTPEDLAKKSGERHFDTPEALRALTLRSGDSGSKASSVDGGNAVLGLYHFRYAPGFWSQGKKLDFPLEGTMDRPQHRISKDACLANLRGITLQTDAQRARCKGSANMVPIYRGGKEEDAKTCIDVFEYPNVACELPFVWGNPTDAQAMCAAEGKRLCAQSEWNLACGGDPAGGPDSRYAYGSEPDLEICNTNKPHPMRGTTKSWVCSVTDAKTAWETCATETEPSGAFPKCRSRFGVYDQHGNVAEMMSRKEAATVYTQLKGSAFFYVDVFRRHDDPSRSREGRETYPDQCNFDPRWHVEELSKALHSNYHLGFRCCRDI